MSNTRFPVLGIANFTMAATPMVAIIVAYLTAIAH
jgi:hypothetical protein